jgi:hypothetical protein
MYTIQNTSETHVHKITNVIPVFYMPLSLNLVGANPLLQPLEGVWVGPENISFLGLTGTRFTRNFQGLTLPVALEMGLPASKSLRPALFKQQVRYISS